MSGDRDCTVMVEWPTVCPHHFFTHTVCTGHTVCIDQKGRLSMQMPRVCCWAAYFFSWTPTHQETSFPPPTKLDWQSAGLCFGQLSTPSPTACSLHLYIFFLWVQSTFQMSLHCFTYSCYRITNTQHSHFIFQATPMIIAIGYLTTGDRRGHGKSIFRISYWSIIRVVP